jgi:hypothetical protein
MKKTIIIMITALLILAGCTSGSDNDQSISNPFGSGNGNSVSSSSSGVSLEFTDGNPPQDMFIGSPVNFAFVFKNYQLHDVENMEVRVKGFDRSYVSGLDESYSITRVPKASEALGAGTFAGLVASGVVVDGFVGDYDFKPEFEYCYMAKTTFRETVCVPSLTNQCEVDYNAETTQNGPISVKINRVNSISDNVQISFTLENKGQGETRTQCFNDQDYTSPYVLNSVKLGTLDGSCTPQGTDDYLLGDGKGSFFCEFSRSQDGSYPTQLTLELEYLYEQEIQRSYTVIDPTQ